MTTSPFPAFFAIRSTTPSLSSRVVEVHVVGGVDSEMPRILGDLEERLRAGLTSLGAQRPVVTKLGNNGRPTGLRVSCDDDEFYELLTRQVVPYFRTQVEMLVRAIHGASVDVLVSAP